MSSKLRCETNYTTKNNFCQRVLEVESTISLQCLANLHSKTPLQIKLIDWRWRFFSVASFISTALYFKRPRSSRKTDEKRKKIWIRTRLDRIRIFICNWLCCFTLNLQPQEPNVQTPKSHISSKAPKLNSYLEANNFHDLCL